MNKFVTGEELNAVELLRGRTYYLRVADDITKMTTIVATYVETTTDGNRTTCLFEDAYVKTPDKINADKLIAGGRVAIKNYEGDKLAPLAAVYNPETLKSKKLRTKPFLLAPEKEREEAAAHPQEGKRRYEWDNAAALSSLKRLEAVHKQEKEAAFLKYMTAPKEEKDAEMQRIGELKRAHAKQKTVSKRLTGNLFKEARRAPRKEVVLDEFSFEEGKAYALPVEGGVIVATFRKRAGDEFAFDEGKGDYASELITKDGRVALNAASAEVFNPRTLRSAALESAPTRLASNDASLSELSSEGLVYRPRTPRLSPYKPSGRTRAKSTVKSRPAPSTLAAFLSATRGAEAPDAAYSTALNATDLGYLYLMKKYKSRCVLPGGLVYTPKEFEEGQLTYEVKSKNVVKKARAIGDDLRKCVESGVSVIFIPFRIKFLTTEMAHANMLIYRPLQKVVERFEPQTSSDKKVNAALKKLFEQTLQPKLGELDFKFPQEEMNDALAQLHLPPMKGLQELEILADGKKEEEGGGYCQMWSLFVMECMLINPEMSTEDIIRQCYEVSKADPQYLRDLIRGYVQNMSVELEKAMGKKADIKRGQALTQKQRVKMAHLAEALAALYQKRHARTRKNEGSASSHSSAFKDSSGFSTEMELP